LSEFFGTTSVLFLAHQSVFRQIIFALLYRQHGLVFPLLRLCSFLLRLALKSFLQGQRFSHPLLGLSLLGFQIADHLCQHQLRIFSLVQCGVGVGAQDVDETIENTHNCFLRTIVCVYWKAGY
jgi:hypothetical protein